MTSLKVTRSQTTINVIIVNNDIDKDYIFKLAIGDYYVTYA